MFDMGFEPQVMKIVDNVRPDRMTVMFSATFPRQMEALARRILSKPVEVTVGGRSVVCADVEQHVVSGWNCLSYFLAILGPNSFPSSFVGSDDVIVEFILSLLCLATFKQNNYK